MSIIIQMADDGRSAVVNGKHVYQDTEDQWRSRDVDLTFSEKQKFHNHLAATQGRTFLNLHSLTFCKVGKQTPAV